jgi:N-acetylglucosamine-6-phosphate deacetylase
MRLAVEAALVAGRVVPARALGLPDAGRIDAGLRADLVVLDDNLEIETVFVGGDERVAA